MGPKRFILRGCINYILRPNDEVELACQSSRIELKKPMEDDFNLPISEIIVTTMGIEE